MMIIIITKKNTTNLGKIKVNNKSHSWNVETSTRYISRYKNTAKFTFELVVVVVVIVVDDEGGNGDIDSIIIF